jgi:hypothetical protein
MVAACWAKLGATLEKLLCDGSADTRLFARRATRSVAFVCHDIYEEFLSRIDPKLRKAIGEEYVPPPGDATARKPAKAAPPPAVSQSLPVIELKPRAPSVGAKVLRRLTEEIGEGEESVSFELVPGSEAVFLRSLDSARSAKATIAEHFPRIFENLIVCCRQQTVALVALSLLVKMIAPFAPLFEPQLPSLFRVLFSLRPSRSLEAVYGELRAHFSATKLLAAIDFRDASLPALSFCATLTELSRRLPDAMIQSVYGLGFRLMNSDRVSFARVVNATRPAAFLLFLDSLSEADVADVREALLDLCPAVKWPGHTIPVFDPNDSEWLGRVIGITRKIAPGEWPEIRAPVFDNLNRALLSGAMTDDVLKTIAALFRQFGTEGYHRVISGIVLHFRNECAKQAEAVAALLLRQVPLPDIFLAFGEKFSDPDENVARNAIDFIRLLVQGLTPDVLLPIVEPLAASLTPQLESPHPLIRKSVVFCFVDLKLAVGSALDGPLAKLTRPQRRLIGIYVSKGKVRS